MTEQQTNELNKQQAVYALVLRVAEKLKSIENLNADIRLLSKELEEDLNVKGSYIVALASELVKHTSTKAAEKHNDIVADLATLKTNVINELIDRDDAFNETTLG